MEKHWGNKCDGKHGHGEGHSNAHKIHDTLVKIEIPFLLENIKWAENESILDYGTGNGNAITTYFASIVQKNGSKITAVDLSSSSIEKAIENHGPKEEFKCVSFSVGNIMDDSNWHIKNEIFDKVTSLHVVQHIENYAEFFEKIHKQIKSGGQMGFSIPINYIPKIVLGIRKKWAEFVKFDGLPIANWCSSEEFIPTMKITLEKIGFKVTNWDLIPFTHEFDDVSQMRGMVVSYVGFKEISEDLKEKIKEDIDQMISELAQIPLDTKPFPFNITSFRVIMEKI